MISVLVTDKNGEIYHWEQLVEDLSWSDAKFGGTRYIMATLRKKPYMKYADLREWNKISIFYGLDEIASGRITQIPIEEAGLFNVSAEGWFGHAQDSLLQRVYCDTSYMSWEDLEGSTTWCKEKFNLDINNHFIFKVPKGIVIDTGDHIRLAYNYLAAVATSFMQINRITFGWGAGAAYDSTKVKLALYARTGVTEDLLWTAPSGAGSGSQDIALGTKRDYLYFTFERVADYTAVDDNYWVSIITPKVYGYHDGAITNIYASEVIKDILPYCPLISQDIDSIEDTAYTIEPLVFMEPTSVLEIIEELNKYHNYLIGVRSKTFEETLNKSSDNLPTLYFMASDPTAIDYYTSEIGKYPCELSLSGPATDNVYNRVFVRYTNVMGRSYFLVCDDESEDNYINQELNADNTPGVADWVWRATEISVNTSSLTIAQDVGDLFLDVHSRPRNAGTIKIQGKVRKEGGELESVLKMKSGKNIRVENLFMPDSLTVPQTNVCDGLSTFEIYMIEFDAISEEVTLHIDGFDESELDIVLAKLEKRQQRTA